MAPLAQNVSQISAVAADQPPPQLPREIIIIIAECLLDARRTSDLAALSLLDRALSSAIQSILWGHITVQTHHRCERIAQTLRSYGSPERRAELAVRIHSMTAILNTRPSPGEQLFLATHLIGLYALCPSLRHITITGGRDGEPGEQLHPDIRDFPRLGAFTTIRSLTLTGPPGHLGPWLISFLPALEELCLFGDTPVSHFTGTSPRSGTSLRRIVWGLTSPPRLEHLRWLFSNSNDVTGGDITLNVAPVSRFEWERIRQYARNRGMTLCSLVVDWDPVLGQI